MCLAFSMDQDIPDYDMDSEDEKWLSQQAERLDIKPLQYEEMMDRLEKSSGQQVFDYFYIPPYTHNVKSFLENSQRTPQILKFVYIPLLAR